MKLSIWISGIIFFALSTIGQAQIPNNGFENWTNNGSENDPDFWSTNNSNPFISVSPYSPAFAGNYSMKVETFSPGFGVVPGVAQTEFNYSQRPNYIKACIKTQIMPGDKVIFLVSMFQGDSIVASPLFCSFNIDTNINEFTCLYFPISYLSTLIPDSVNIIISAGMGSTQLGTYIIVDELSFENGLGLEDLNKESINVYPNPFMDHLIVTANNITKVELLNVNGERILLQSFLSENQTEIDTHILPQGVYLVRIHTDKGIYHRRLIK
jgi:hypothetical protein